MNSTIVIARYTLDTNILIYAADRNADAAKHRRSLKMLSAAARTAQPLPLQALNEFCHAVTRKKLLGLNELQVSVQEHSLAFRLIASEALDTAAALSMHTRTRYSYWDCLLLATAARAGCYIFFSEDMQDGFTVENMQIVNPFARSETDLEALLQT